MFPIKRYVEVDDVLCTRETDKALLCVINGEETWVPKSQIDMQNSDVTKEDDEGVLLVSEWFAQKIGAA